MTETERNRITETGVYDSNKLTQVMGLPKLLRAVASRLENSAVGVSRELLERAAERIEHLEAVATVATHVISFVPKPKGRDRHAAKIPIGTLIRLCDALNVEEDFKVRRVR